MVRRRPSVRVPPVSPSPSITYCQRQFPETRVHQQFTSFLASVSFAKIGPLTAILCLLMHTNSYRHLPRFFTNFDEIRSSRFVPVAYPGFFFEGGSTNSVEDRGQRERGSGGGSPLVRGSGGSCNLVQEISFHMVKFS